MAKLLLIGLLVISSFCYSETLTSKNIIEPSKPQVPEKQIQSWENLIGSWYGSQKISDGRLRKWVMHNNINGTFVVKFKIYGDNGSVEEQSEYGDWGVSGNIVFTTFRGWIKDGKKIPSEPLTPYAFDAYYIIKLTKDSFEYKSAGTDTSYSEKKVQANYVF